ncbi:MAG: CDP-alcohol phosphatidyltransferase family protein [Anaeromyxobacter sp.]|nr:CDP-alcohol phosphatidyltransferase family protein [Anaeromyxobacter sp.]MBL0277135.1 CDP-alcohol phosphatidyltransferase family protein [Anaeromyxobacter sp.]
MTGADRLALVGHLALLAVSLAAFAVARPPAPARLAGRRGALALAGRWAYWLLRPLVGAARALGLSADALTWIGVAITCLAGWLASTGAWGLAGLALLWGSAFDMLDGELARATGTASPAGAFLDSNLDRLSEIALFAGVALGLPGRLGPSLAVAALVASLMVSYARARGEGLGVECPAFGLERPQRVVIMLSFLLPAPFLSADTAGWMAQVGAAHVAVGAGLTAAARMVVIRRRLQGRAFARPAGPPAAGAP